MYLDVYKAHSHELESEVVFIFTNKIYFVPDWCVNG